MLLYYGDNGTILHVHVYIMDSVHTVSLVQRMCDEYSTVKGLSSRRRRREGMQRIQTAKSNMLLNLNLRDVLLRGRGAHTHHKLTIHCSCSCCAQYLALDTLLSRAQECTESVMTGRQC